MATVSVRGIVDTLMEKNGKYPGDTMIVVKIVEYENAFNGGLAWGLIYEDDDLDAYRASPFINNPRTIWERA